MKPFQSNQSVSPPAWFLGGILVFLVLSVQLPGINRPLGGHFASYQSSVMASISRNMLRENFRDILVPKIDLLIGGERAWHLNQYPFPSLAAAVDVRLFGGTLEFWGRFQAILCNLLSILLCGLIARRLLDRISGWIAAYLFGLSPFSLIYGQTFMSESMALTGLLLAVYLYLKALRQDQGWCYGNLALSALSLSFAITGRIHLIVLGPLFAVDILRRPHRWRAAVLFGTIALLMPTLWYGFTYFVSVHSAHVMTNIFIQKAERPVEAILYYLSPGFLIRLADTLGQRVMTPLIWPFFMAGLWTLRKQRLQWLFFVSGIWLNLLLIVLLPQKIIDHEFYLIALPPFLAWVAAVGVLTGVYRFSVVKRKVVLPLFMGLYFLLSLRYAYGPVFKNQKDISQIQYAAAFVHSATRAEDKLIVFGRGNAVSVYYADRPCWSIEIDELGGELAYYLKNPKFSGVDMQEVAREENAMKSFVSWVEYFRSQGARYFLATKRNEFQNSPELLVYLNSTAECVSPADAGFYLFKLK